MNITSTGHVDYHLSMLEKKGYIIRQAKTSRGIELTKPFQGIPVMGRIAAGEPLESSRTQRKRSMSAVTWSRKIPMPWW